jgi:hypothetical protein
VPPIISLSDTTPRQTTDKPSSWAQLLVLLGLWGFAVTQPILALLGDEPSFFISRSADRLAIVAFAVGLAVVPPALLWLVTIGATRISAPIGRWVHLTMVAGLVLLATLPLLRSAGLTNPALMVAGSTASAAVFTYLYARFQTVALWSRYTAVLPAIALVAFSVSPSGTLLRGSANPSALEDHPDLKSVVFLMLDEFPTKSLLDDDGGIDDSRFPNLASFGSDATWYRNYTTVATGTEQAVPAILSGHKPYEGDPISEVYPDNLFTLLAPTHSLTVSEAMTALCPYAKCEGDLHAPGLLAQSRALAAGSADIWRKRVTPGSLAPTDRGDFAEALERRPTAAPPMQDAGAELHAAPRRFEEFLESLQPAQQPRLDYLHLVLPHGPWRLGPDGQRYEANAFPRPPWGAGEDDQWLAALLQQRHLYQARYVDTLIGRLMTRLRQVDLYDDSLIVVMADHGIAFANPSANSRLLDNDDDNPTTVSGIAYAPLLIKAPGQTVGQIDDQNVEAVDVLPTIAAILGLEVPWSTDGTPIGSAEMTARGPAKRTYDFGSLLHPTTARPFDYEIDGTQPTASSRWIKGRRDPDRPLAGLLEPLGVVPWLGTSLDSLATGQGMTVVVQEPTQIGRTQGLVRGQVTDPPEAGRVLVAVDGRIVSASPILTIDDQPGSFITLIPARLVSGQTLDLSFAVVPGPIDAPNPTVLAAAQA